MLATNRKKAVIGKRIARILPDTTCAAIGNYKARQTSSLHRTPRKKASTNAKAIFAVATRVALSPTAPPAPVRTVENG
jgi:hypothetical protein